MTDHPGTASVRSTGPWARTGPVGALVDRRISRLQEGVRRRDSASTAMLAHLRRAAGTPAGSAPDVWSVTLSDELAAPGAADAATPGEIAVHTALTLYAVHQQSSSGRMHQRGRGFGAAVRSLRPADAPTDPIRRRFQAVATADSMDELTHHARGLVQLLRAGAVPLDYALLADQFMTWQQGDPVRVRLHWARDFYRTESVTTPAATP